MRIATVVKVQKIKKIKILRYMVCSVNYLTLVLRLAEPVGAVIPP